MVLFLIEKDFGQITKIILVRILIRIRGKIFSFELFVIISNY